MSKVFISSTFSDLFVFREAVYKTLRRMRYDVIAMEDYVAREERPLDKCLSDVAACDVYVGIFAWRYGFVPSGRKRSVTELEYLQAGKAGKERLIFLLDEKMDWPESDREKGLSGEKIAILRNRLKKNHIVQFFKTPNELSTNVATAITQWAQKQLEDQIDLLRKQKAQADVQRRSKQHSQHVVNLRPLDMTHSFKDRQREIRALSDHLSDNNVRLISVVGRGGIGKTAIVSKVLGDLEQDHLPDSIEHFHFDGIIYLSSRSTGLSLDRIYADVGRILGEPSASLLRLQWSNKNVSLEGKVEYLLEKLQNGRYVILLDNFEDYLNDDNEIHGDGLRIFIDRCLNQPIGLKLIVTSRERVRMVGLQKIRAIPLDEGLPEDAAVSLLRDLDPQGTLGLRDAPESDLLYAAQMAHGIPRALEILAGILDRDQTTDLSNLLADKRLFSGQVLNHLIAEGYRRLRVDEKRVLEALAILNQPVEQTYIAYLLHPWFPGLDVQGCLRHLTEGFFVSINRGTGECSLHPLDRDYAIAQLSQSNNKEKYSFKNLEHRAANLYEELRKPESEWKSLDDISPQLSEFDHRCLAGEYNAAGRVLEKIHNHLFLWGHYSLMLDLGERLLDHLQDPYIQSFNFGMSGNSYHYLGQVQRALEMYEKAVDIAHGLGDRASEGKWIGNIGLALSDLGKVEQAIKYYKQALDLSSEVEDLYNESNWLGLIGVSYRLMGDIDQAISYCEKALKISREIGNRSAEGAWLGNIGTAYRQLGDWDKAIEYYEKALEIAREINERQREEEWLGNLGVTYRYRGKMAQSEKYCQQALDISRDIGHRRGEGEWLNNLGIVADRLGRLQQAIDYYHQSLLIAREVKDKRHEGDSLNNLGVAFRKMGQINQAMEYHLQSLNTTRQILNRLGEGKALGNLGIDLFELGQEDQATEDFQQALGIAQQIGDRKSESNWIGYLGAINQSTRDLEQALDLYNQCTAMSREIGNFPVLAYHLIGLGKTLFAMGAPVKAKDVCAEALSVNESASKPEAALLLGIVLFHLGDPAAKHAFTVAEFNSRHFLDQSTDYYFPRYILATSVVGQAICDADWSQTCKRSRLLAQPLNEYKHALRICADLGVVRTVLWWLDAINKTVVSGLEPIFELFQPYNRR